MPINKTISLADICPALRGVITRGWDSPLGPEFQALRTTTPCSHIETSALMDIAHASVTEKQQSESNNIWGAC